MLINGAPSEQVSIHDRGLQYGDGVFRTLRIQQGRVLHWSRHYFKLQQDCAALKLPCPDAGLLLDDLQYLATRQEEATAKIIITRGPSVRGYTPAGCSASTRIVTLAPPPEYPSEHYEHGIKLHVCELRLGHQPRLAGIKHLNRLENVLATAEWGGTGAAEGLMLDYAGHVIEGTRSNIFMVRNGALFTPDLSCCGIKGIQRDRVMEKAQSRGISCKVTSIGLEELLAADEIFLVNSIIGLWPVSNIREHEWHCHPLSLQIQEWLNESD